RNIVRSIDIFPVTVEWTKTAVDQVGRTARQMTYFLSSRAILRPSPFCNGGPDGKAAPRQAKPQCRDGPRETTLRGRFCFSRTGCAVRQAGREKYGRGNVLVSLFNIKLLKNNKKLLQNDMPCAILLPIQTERGSRI